MTDCLSMNATASRLTTLAREKEEKRAQERRRNLIYLIAEFLWEQRYMNTYDTLFKEAQLSRDIQVCDNIDLENIILEYSDYYYAKFNKYPKLCKKCNNPPRPDVHNSGNTRKEKCKKQEDENNTTKDKIVQKNTNSSGNDLNFGMTITPIFPSDIDRSQQSNKFNRNEKMLKPLKDLYPNGSEWKEIAEIVSREVVLKNLNVYWDDIKGLYRCKTLLKEAAVYPIKYPRLFSGKLGSWNGILLYGPPGTGKTMLAKAVATECNCTFFNITSSSIISKWRGDSEKYLRVLIDLAKYYAPTIIFIDEIDWTTSADQSSSYSEPARRFRAEFLAQLDGLLSTEDSKVILLAATNIPWHIDTALLRRLEKRIFVTLPNEDSRGEILRCYIHKRLHDNKEFQTLIRNTDGYSCADLKLLCKEAWIKQLRPMWSLFENEEIAVDEVQVDDMINCMDHIINAMKSIKPTAKHMIEQYIHWNENFH